MASHGVHPVLSHGILGPWAFRGLFPAVFSVSVSMQALGYGAQFTPGTFVLSLPLQIKQTKCAGSAFVVRDLQQRTGLHAHRHAALRNLSRHIPSELRL